MWRRLFILMTLAAIPCFGDGSRLSRAAGPDKPEAAADLDKLRPGMSQADVRRSLGPPKHVARQILYRRYLEQWVYEGPNAVRIEFDCVRGKEPQILTVHPLTLPRP